MQSASAPENYYDLLEIQREASRAEIRRAFLRMAHICHPDLNSDDLQAEIRFRHIRQAYEVLYDPTARAAYDDQLRGKVQPSACRQEWPRSKPIVTSPPERPHVDWNSFETTSSIERWTDWRTRNVVLLGLSVAAIVLTTITTTHVRAINRIRAANMDQEVALGRQIDERGEPTRLPSRRSIQELQANNDSASDDSPNSNSSEDAANNTSLSKGPLPTQPSPPSTPVAPIPWAPMTDLGEPMDSVMESVNSLKALQNSPSAGSFPAHDGTLPFPPRGPQMEWTPALNPAFPAPDSLPTAPFIPTEPAADFQLTLPAPADPKTNHLPPPSSPHAFPVTPDRQFPRSDLGGPSYYPSNVPSHYDGGDYQEPRSLFGQRPPTTRSAVPSWQRSGSPEPPRGLWNNNSSVFSAPPASSSWGSFSGSPPNSSRSGLPNSPAQSLNSSGWKVVPMLPSAPTMPNFPTPAPGYPKRPFGSTTLGAAQISPYAEDYP